MPDRKVLIASNVPADVEVLRAFLGEVDCRIEVAADGHDTLEKVASADPALILLDIVLPGISGEEICRKLKGDPTTDHIMVLMVTTLNELGDIEQAVAAGCDDFLSKPFNKLELVKRVEKMLNSAT